MTVTKIFLIGCVVGALFLHAPDVKPSTVAGGTDNWELVKEQSGIKVFRRNEPSSPILSVKGVASIEAKANDIFAVLKANAFAHEWMPLVDKRYTLRELSSNSRIEVTLIGMPWPLTDRYIVTLSEASPRQNGWLIESQSVRGDYSDKGKIEAWMHRSYMTLTETPDGKGKIRTEIVVEMHSEPKGQVPNWLVNSFQARWPLEFIDGLRWFVKKKAGPLGIVPKGESHD